MHAEERHGTKAHTVTTASSEVGATHLLLSHVVHVQVLYATLCFRVGVWDGDEGLPRSQKQRYFLDFTVSYISLPQQPVPVKKPAPPLVVPLPADIFYPFVEVTGASAALSPSWWLVLGACLAMGVLHQMLEA